MAAAAFCCSAATSGLLVELISVHHLTSVFEQIGLAVQAPFIARTQTTSGLRERTKRLDLITSC